MRVFEFGDFLRKIYLQRRFGHLSPLTLLRVEVNGWHAECDWLMRPLCAWDADRQPIERARNASLQAIEDALSVRKLLFRVLPEVGCAVVRVYRRGSDDRLELIVVGTVKRKDRVSGRIRSLAMKGKLYGLQFKLNEGALEALETKKGQDRSAPKFVGSAEISISGGNSNGI